MIFWRHWPGQSRIISLVLLTLFSALLISSFSLNHPASQTLEIWWCAKTVQLLREESIWIFNERATFIPKSSSFNSVRRFPLNGGVRFFSNYCFLRQFLKTFGQNILTKINTNYLLTLYASRVSITHILSSKKILMPSRNIQSFISYQLHFCFCCTLSR